MEKVLSTNKTQSQHTSSAIARTFEGTVVSAPGQKSISVLVKRVALHQKYKKQYTLSKKYAVHDEKNEARIGDSVLFQECRPLSKRKRWYLVKVLKKAV